MKTPILAGLLAALCLSAPAVVGGPAQAEEKPSLLVFVTSPDAQTQGMALVLATASVKQGAEVRVLLCGPGGDLALADAPQTTLKPRDVTPQGLLQGLIDSSVPVEVCALYLPNAAKTEADLIEGVGVAQPPAIAGEMLREDVKLFTF